LVHEWNKSAKAIPKLIGQSVDFSELLRDFKTYRPESRANFSRYCESNRRGHFIHPPLRYPVANVSQRSRKPVDMSQHSRNISLRIRCSNPFRDFSDQPRRYLVFNRKKTIKIYVEFISIAIFHEFLQFPRLSWKDRSLWTASEDICKHTKFCGYMELTFRKVGGWKWVREAGRYFHLPMRNRHGKATSRKYSISECVVSRRGTVIKNLFVAGKCIDFCRPTTSYEQYCIFGGCVRFIILTSWTENQYLLYVFRMNSRDRLSRANILYWQLCYRYSFHNF